MLAGPGRSSGQQASWAPAGRPRIVTQRSLLAARSGTKPVPVVVVERQAESLHFFAFVIEPGHVVQVRVSGHEQRSEPDLRKVPGVVDGHVDDLPARSPQLSSPDDRMHTDQQGAWTFVTAAGADVHELARGERGPARAAAMQRAAIRPCDPDRALQLILIRKVSTWPMPLSPDAPRNPIGAGALGDQHLRAVYGDCHGITLRPPQTCHYGLPTTRSVTGPNRAGDTGGGLGLMPESVPSKFLASITIDR